MVAEKTILDIFLRAQDKLVLQPSDLSLESISNMVHGNAINIKPKYQRRARWTIIKQSALIESFLLNIPVPPIYLAEDEYGHYSVIDGKQRITSIYNFIQNNQALTGLEKFKEINGLTFKQLPPTLTSALRIRPYIRVITLLKQSDPNLKYEVFTRLNKGGERLLPQEIRNAVYEGNLNDSIIKLSRNEFLMEQLKSKSEHSKPYKEMIDVEYVLRFFTLKEFWKQFPGNMSKAMDSFMQKHQKASAQQIEKMEEHFTKCMKICKEIWGKQAFRRPDGRDEMIQGIFDAQTVAISEFIDKHEKKLLKYKDEIRDGFNNLYYTQTGFQLSMRQFTSNIKQVENRIQKMIDLINSII